jgi:hypothetical protein
MAMSHLDAFVLSEYFAFIYVLAYRKEAHGEEGVSRGFVATRLKTVQNP